MGFLTKEQIFAADDLPVEIVHVPEWGGDVRLKMLTAAERDAFEASTVQMRGGKQKQNLANLRARLVALCIVDEEGRRIFQSGDVTRLGNKSASALQRLFDKCNEMNALSEDDIEELTEGFEETPAEDSSSS
ncbi:hypothetical protein C6N75_10005 [Streptomyces solincola]|uniref:Tail assembly chaperone n=1 Tax=Streptomyces solincola TaxID=2100817 RepID=A0A2S9PYI2_9ACTN|nr:hypothetical protein [Streptomyces solincola]PRH79407.1 hypothetical protein C6N75_10005 [Streptomyces solincola]